MSGCWKRGEVFCALACAVALGLCNAGLARAADTGRPLTVEDIFAHGSMIGHVPSGLNWSPDGSRLTFMDAQGIMEIDLATGEPRVLVSKKQLSSLSGGQANEQDADHRNRYQQAAYLWTPDGRNLLLDQDGVF